MAPVCNYISSSGYNVVMQVILRSIPKTLTSIKHRFDLFLSDRCVIDVDTTFVMFIGKVHLFYTFAGDQCQVDDGACVLVPDMYSGWCHVLSSNVRGPYPILLLPKEGHGGSRTKSRALSIYQHLQYAQPGCTCIEHLESYVPTGWQPNTSY